MIAAKWWFRYYDDSMNCVNHGPPTFLWERATPITVGWFAGNTWKNKSK
jgi:hypothetical protein